MSSEPLLEDKSSNNCCGKWGKKWSNLCVKIFPSGFLIEFKLLFEIFIPVLMTNLCRFINPIISGIVCGHLSKIEFASAALANSIINILGVSVDMGFASAFDTLLAQYYGANQKMKMGALLQRAMILMTVLYLGLTFLHLNIEPILILLRQDPLVSELCTQYLTFYLPGLFFDFQFLAISRYLQNQNIVYPSTISAFMMNVFNIVLQPIFVLVLGYGIKASAIIQGLSCFFGFSLQLSYVLISKVYKGTWPGFSWKACFGNWKIIFMLGIPGMFMLGLEEWNYEIAAFVAGALDATQLAAQSIAFQVATIQYMISVGLSVALTIRLGQYLGMNDLSRLRTTFRTGIVIGVVTNTTLAMVTISLRHYIPRIFTNEPDILKEGEGILLVVAFCEFSDLISVITQSMIRATGRQGIGALIMFATYYLIGVPLGILLIFVGKMNISGMWIGLIVGASLQGVILSVFICQINWKEEFKKVNKNALNDIISEPLSDEKLPLFNNSNRLRHAETDIDSDSATKDYPSQLRKFDSLPTVFIQRSFSVSNRFTTSREYLVEQEILSDSPSNDGSFKSVFKISHFLILSGALVIFIVGILLRIFLPKHSYLPCIPRTNFSVSLYQNDIEFLCALNITTPIPNN